MSHDDINAKPKLDNTKKSTANNSNWYAKLHPTGKDDTGTPKIKKRKNLLNLSLFFRIWLAVGIIIIISGIVVFNQLFNYVRPITQQVIEDTLVDTAMLLSTNLQQPLESGDIYYQDYQKALDSAFSSHNIPSHLSDTEPQTSSPDLTTWYHLKRNSSFRVYVTDATGKVVYDSLPDEGNAEGEDYSKWNDVHLTLSGKYGARTTRNDADQLMSSVMYVAQPIYSSTANPDSLNDNSTLNTQDIIGVVSVGKPTASVLPYLEATRQRMLSTSLLISMVTLFMAGLIAWWLKQSMMLVTRYTQSLAQDTKKPYFYLGSELNELTDTIESMKHRLENRAYVTDYVHTLTHELKSPLTAIRASGELLEESDLEEEDRLMLSQTITEQSIKLQSLIDRLLLLAKIEQPTFKLSMQAIQPTELIQTLVNNYETQRQFENVAIHYRCTLDNPHTVSLLTDEFWLTQALQNILDNALYFAHTQVVITLSTHVSNKTNYIDISIINDGSPIPSYALDKVFDRYFSLSHHQLESDSMPNLKQKNKKGTGLGLTLVKQVIERHAGTISIKNVSSSTHNASSAQKTSHSLGSITSGVDVSISLPLNHNPKILDSE